MGGLIFYLDAFHELSTSRPVGMAVGPIPFTAIADYFRIYQLEEEFDDFLYVIRRLDRVFLELNEEENKPKGNKNGRPNSNKNN